MLQTAVLVTMLTLICLGLSTYVQTQGSGVSLTGRSTRRLLVGARFEVTCDAARAGGPSNIQWHRGGTLLAINANGFTVTAVGDNSVLSKSAIEESDGGDYMCKPTVPDVDSASTSLIVFDIRTTGAQLDEEHGTVTLRCIIHDLSGSYPMEWYRGADAIEATEDKYVIDANNNTLTIHEVAVSEIGEYKCGISMADGQSFKRNVFITAEVHIRDFDKSKNLIEGDRLSLDCQAWGYPHPTVTWAKNGLPIDASDPRITFADLDNMPNATLRIADLLFSDRAEYNCSATNEFGRADSNVILIRVKDKLAALWPFLGICAEVVILCVIIWVYERRHAKKLEEEDNREEADHLTNSHDHKGNDEIRQRK